KNRRCAHVAFASYKRMRIPAMPLGALTIRDRTFAIVEATLMGNIVRVDDRWVCVWHIDIDAEGRRFPQREFVCEWEWEPQAYVQELRGNVRWWKEFEGGVFKAVDGGSIDFFGGETFYGLYVCEHTPISSNCLRFGKRKNYSFDLSWKGSADVYAGGE